MKLRALTVVLMIVALATVQAAEYSWQKPKAKVLPMGDLQWMPEPFEFQAGDEVS